FILSLVAGALMVSAPSQARQVSTRSQCLASCGTALSDTCGWITRRGKFNACKNRLMRQCRRWGVDTMCPAPSPTTPTTVPPPSSPTTTTTTTVPYIPPTTTTLPPPVDRLGQFAGTTWNFVYTIVSTWTDTYYLGHTYQFTSSGVRMLDGTDEYGDGIGMSLTASYDIP